ncbi:hypothetical protein H9P43_004308 [Blastocladiella emersonii ATCC 22665]|nr:hypothetical protein H9P43_004308 [Blastocladiella emersonii ATCC 22665]
MECINPQKALLSNYEVYALLQSKRAEAAAAAKRGPKPDKGDKAAKAKKQGMAVEREVYYYLTKVHDVATHWSAENVTAYLEAMAHYKLLKGEKLMLLNVRPRNLVGLLTCIEEADDRFDNDELAGILEVLDTTLPLPMLEDEEMAEAGAAEPEETMAMDED